MSKPTTNATIHDRESVRLETDARDLLAAAVRKFGVRNKNRLFNACFRQSLSHLAGKRIKVASKSDFERKVFP